MEKHPQLKEVFITVEACAFLVKKFPVLRKKAMIGHRQLLAYLLFIGTLDRRVVSREDKRFYLTKNDQPYVIMPSQAIQDCYREDLKTRKAAFKASISPEKADEIANRPYTLNKARAASIDLLRAFKEEVHDLDIFESTVSTYSRAVALPEYVSQFYELNRKSKYPYRVSFKTLRPKKEFRKEATAKEIQELNNNFSQDHILKQAAEYLHNRPASLYELSEEVVESFYQQVDREPDLARRMRLNALAQRTVCQTGEVPKYYPSTNTSRIFSSSPILYLTKELRQRLYPNAFDMDLRAAQLAILAKTCRVDSLTELLLAEKNIWEYFCSKMNFKLEEKGRIKKAVYSLCYGGTSKTIAEEASFSSAQYAKFSGIAEIKDLKKKRDQRMKTIVQNNGLYCELTNKFIPLENKEDIRSLLSLESQLYESALISPVFKAAEVTEDFHILLFQHDGITVVTALDSQEARQNVVRYLASAVEEKARTLGIITTLTLS